MIKGSPVRGIIIVLCIVLIAWMNPEADKTSEGNRLYDKELYDEAAAKYAEVLIDLPNSALLHFNIGDAAYKKENYKEAVESFTRALSMTSDPLMEGKILYNLGNCKYRQGRPKEMTDIREAISLYKEALNHYKRALERFPEDPDAKYNHEFVERRIKQLLEVQQQGQQQDQQGEQGQQQRQQRGQQQRQIQQAQGQQQQEGQAGDQQQTLQQRQEGQEGDQQQGQQRDQQEGQEGDQQDQEGTTGRSENEDEDEGEAGVQGEELREKEGAGQRGNLSKREAKMLLDSLKDEELGLPDNIETMRQLGEVLKDW